MERPNTIHVSLGTVTISLGSYLGDGRVSMRLQTSPNAAVLNIKDTEYLIREIRKWWRENGET